MKNSTSLTWLKYTLAALSIHLGLLITPWMKRLAYAQRGYYAIGGELTPLVISIIAAVAIIQTISRMQANYSNQGGEHPPSTADNNETAGDQNGTPT